VTIMYILDLIFRFWLAAASPSVIVYIGTYTGDGTTDSKGIYAYQLDTSQSTLAPLGLAVETPNPSYVFVHPSKKYLYAANEQDDGRVTAFQIDPTNQGRLQYLNQQSSRGSGPCYLSMTKQGDYLFVANYNNATVATLPVDISNGNVKPFTGFDQQVGSSIDPDRQQSAHAHSIRLDPEERFALSADLGSDQIYHYRFQPQNGSIVRTSITSAARPGDGPRHLIFSSNSRFVYLTNELKSTITVFSYFPTMTVIQIISTLPENYTLPNTAAELVFHPINEQFLYASNRGHDSIAVFSIDSNTGRLTLLQHIGVQGHTPRNFNISPDGRFLIVANQDSNNIVLYTIDSNTGRISPTGTNLPISKPTCVKFLSL